MLRIAFFGFLASISLTSLGQKMTSTAVGSPEVLYSENGVSITSQLTTCTNEERHETMTFKLLSITN